MVSIARKNLFHDKRRFSITVTGISASLLLIFFGLGMNIGTLSGMLLIIDKSNADIWILNEGNTNLVEEISFVNESLLSNITNIVGVKKCQGLIYSTQSIANSEQRLPIIVVGVNTSSDFVLPWNIISGNISHLSENNSIIVDKSLKIQFDNIIIGTEFKISNYELEVVGICEGAKSFIYPFVFTSYSNAKKICGLIGQANYFLIKAEDGIDASELAETISENYSITAITSRKVRSNTIMYMQFSAGMGLGTFIFALVGFFVAIIIISLTTYTSTMEKIPEYGTLKAIGASKRDIYLILLEQIIWSMLVSFVFGLALSFLGAFIINKITLMPIKMPPLLIVVTFFTTLLFSTLGALTSIRVVNKIDPAIVFRG